MLINQFLKDNLTMFLSIKFKNVPMYKLLLLLILLLIEQKCKNLAYKHRAKSHTCKYH